MRRLRVGPNYPIKESSCSECALDTKHALKEYANIVFF